MITQAADVTAVPPTALDVRGVVLGPPGKRLAGFSVFDDVLGGWPTQRQVYVTDEGGQFHFTNSGQLLRFENAKYRPVARAVAPGGAVRSVQLGDAKGSDWAIPACEENGGNSTRIGFAVQYALRPAMDSQLNDEQGDLRRQFVFPSGGEPLNPETGHREEFAGGPHTRRCLPRFELVGTAMDSRPGGQDRGTRHARPGKEWGASADGDFLRARFSKLCD